MQKVLKISIKDLEGKSAKIVDFFGDFDKVGYSDIKEEINAFVTQFKDSFLIFDFHKLKFINSEGIGYLMEVHTHLMKNDQKLVIIGPNAHVQDVFDAIGITQIISVYPKMSDFINELK